MAEFISDCVIAHGGTVVGPVGRVSAALDLARAAALDGALLDVNLAGDYSFPVATELINRQIPFIFLTGYDHSVFPPELASVPLVPKPFNPERLIQVIAQEFRPAVPP
jgi:two-component SAPR family response regulator